jgi:glycosyltransferase involved in cell wall biosynthesis
LNDHVTLTGWLPHDRVADAYREIDVFVYPRRVSRSSQPTRHRLSSHFT